MAIVTFLSDFGLSDQYVAAVKAKILGVNPNITIVDITHQISTCDISHAAYTLQSVFREFPKGTVHIVAVSPSGIHSKKYIAIKLEDHFFVGEDSGLFGIISKQAPIAMVDINKLSPIESTFDAKDILAPVAAKLASGGNIYEMGVELENITGFTPTIAKIEKPQIAGNIVHIDHFGNLITNIFKDEFQHIHKINKECPFEISFRKEKFTSFHQKVGEVGEGECFAFFNSDNRLEIGINQGNGSQLLGLRINNQVFINFKLEE